MITPIDLTMLSNSVTYAIEACADSPERTRALSLSNALVSKLTEVQQEMLEYTRGLLASNAVTTYMLGDGFMEEPMEFLRCWNEGNFDALREEWPNAPIEIYYADPLADHEAIDAALAAELEKAE